jgi:hypothetical protein
MLQQIICQKLRANNETRHAILSPLILATVIASLGPDQMKQRELRFVLVSRRDWACSLPTDAECLREARGKLRDLRVPAMIGTLVVHEADGNKALAHLAFRRTLA